MIRAIDGTMIFHAKKPRSEPTIRARDRIRAMAGMERRFNPSTLAMRSLRAALCDLGPAKCKKCGLCEYGKEYIRRKQNG